MDYRMSEREYVDYLLWHLGSCISIAPEVSRIRTYLIDNGMPLQPTDEWISGWLGAEFDKLNARYTEDDPDLTAMVISGELDALDILPRIKAAIGDSVARNCVGYLYAYAKFTDLRGPWMEVLDFIETRYEEAARDARIHHDSAN